MSKPLDITGINKTGEELRQAILDGVKDTQGALMMELPDQLIMTREQFNELQPDPELQQMYQSKDFLYHTPLNAMEVWVKGTF